MKAQYFDWDISNGSPFMRAVHIFDLVAHGCASVLLMVVSRHTIGLDRTVSFAVGLLFATHPVHVEAVCNCTSRAEMLYTLIVLLALVAFFETDKLLGAPLHRLAGIPASQPSSATWMAIPILCLCQAVACASKEQGIFFVCMTTALLLIQALILSRSPASSNTRQTRCRTFCRAVLIHVCLWVCTSANILWRGHVSGSRLIPKYSYTMNPLPYLDGTIAKFLTAFNYHVEAFRLMLLPTLQPMRCDYKDLLPVTEVSDPRNISAAALYLVIVAIAATCARALWIDSASAAPTNGKPVGRVRTWLWPTVCFFGIVVTFYLPSSNAIGYVGFHVAERVLYFPSAGVIGLFCVGLHSMARKCLSAGPARVVFLLIILIIAAVLARATFDRVPAWTSTAKLWASDFQNYPWNPSVRGSHATQTYIDFPRDREKLLVAMELIVDSAGLISDSQATTDHVTRIAERLAQLGATKAAIAALDRAIEQNNEIMRSHKQDLARGIIRIDQRWTGNREGYPHIQNCNYLRSKGLCLMMGSGSKAGGNAEFPTTEDQVAAKELALSSFESAVATCKEMRRASKHELYPTTADKETLNVLMMAARASRELNQVERARDHLNDCIAICDRSRRLKESREHQQCKTMLSQL